MYIVRTNIELDEVMIEEARRLTGLGSKRAIVARALEELIRRGRRRAVLRLEGALEWDVPDELEAPLGSDQR